MQLSDRIGASESMATVLFATANASYFGAYAARVRQPPRRVAACVLALLNLALACEAVLYLAVLPAPGVAHPDAPALAVRTLSLLAAAAVSALIVRQQAARGGRRGR